MSKSTSFFIYFAIILCTAVDVRSSGAQWSSCEGNPKLTNNAIWKCAKRMKCIHTKNLPPQLLVTCGPDEICCPEPVTTRPAQVPLRSTSTTKATSPARIKIPVSPTTTKTTRTPAPQTRRTTTAFVSSTSNAYKKANKIALEKCNEYAQYRYVNTTYQNPILGEPDTVRPELNCTVEENLIIDGKPAELTEYPHMALLGYDNDLTDSETWRCGGSLISDQFVLTAAHCSKAPENDQKEVKWAALGILSKSDINEESIGKTVFPIAEHINHPRYKPTESYNDIALLRLKHRIKLSPTIRPICLQHQVELRNNLAVAVTGWGKTFSGESESNELLKTTIHYFDSSVCAGVYTGQNDPQLGKGFDAATMICGGDRKGKHDTCNGDSGGPMQVKMPRTVCMWLQIGITSVGPIYCGSKPAIYTKVAYFLPWIQSVAWPDIKSG